MSIAILIKKGKKKMADKRRILIVMMDGFEPSYLQASDMPNTKQMVAKGTGLQWVGPDDYQAWIDKSYSEFKTIAAKMGWGK